MMGKATWDIIRNICIRGELEIEEIQKQTEESRLSSCGQCRNIECQRMLTWNADEWKKTHKDWLITLGIAILITTNMIWTFWSYSLFAPSCPILISTSSNAGCSLKGDRTVKLSNYRPVPSWWRLILWNNTSFFTHLTLTSNFVFLCFTLGSSYPETKTQAHTNLL
jgi:hypothetical protein